MWINYVNLYFTMPSMKINDFSNAQLRNIRQNRWIKGSNKASVDGKDQGRDCKKVFSINKIVNNKKISILLELKFKRQAGLKFLRWIEIIWQNSNIFCSPFDCLIHTFISMFTIILLYFKSPAKAESQLYDPMLVF